MDVITFPENLLTTSGLSILLHVVISLPVATSYDNIVYEMLLIILEIVNLDFEVLCFHCL